MSTIEQLIEQISALPEADQCELITLISKGLKKSIGKKVKKARDPNAPKKEVKSDSYMFLVNSKVWPILKSLSENESDDEEKKLLRDVSARTQVAKAIWENIKSLDSDERIEKIEAVDEDQVSEAFAEWKTLPRPSSEEKKAAREAKKAAKTEKPVKAAKKATESKPASVASKGSKATSKAAEKSVKAEKPAKAAEEKKAAKAEKKAAKVEEVEEEAEVKAYKWSHNFGKGAIDYERIDVDGTAYLYDIKTKAYLGAYDKKGNKINKAIPDPTA
jgi:hypothetical protein